VTIPWHGLNPNKTIGAAYDTLRLCPRFHHRPGPNCRVRKHPWISISRVSFANLRPHYSWFWKVFNPLQPLLLIYGCTLLCVSNWPDVPFYIGPSKQSSFHKQSFSHSFLVWKQGSLPSLNCMSRIRSCLERLLLVSTFQFLAIFLISWIRIARISFWC